ncbi:hypothetical protein AB4283_23355 [Vibrio splendidus]
MRAFVPLILSFIPNYAPYVEQGFNALQNIPNPYWFVVGGVSSLGTITGLKTDINWLKRVQQDQEQRIRKLEGPNG